MLVLWEAGENPALPRNCKRGHRNRSLGKPGKADCRNRMLKRKLASLLAKPGDRREPSTKPFRVIKET